MIISESVIDIRRETDLETLRQVALLQQGAIEHLQRRLGQLKRELARLQGKSQVELQLEIKLLEEQLGRMQREIYGPATERRPQPSAPPAAAEKPRAGHGRREQPALPMAEVVHHLDEADKICPQCGGALAEWDGQFEEAEEIDYVKCQYQIVKHKRQKYRCACGGCVETAPGPVKLMPQGRYSLDFAAHVAIAKYCDHLPLSRQVRMMRRHGLVVDEQTLFDQLYALLTHLKPSLTAVEKCVLSAEVIGADETRWQVLGQKKGESKKWWVWSAAQAEAVIYKIHPARSAEAAYALLGDYAGIVMCDGYSSYGALRKQPRAKFVLAHCWAHARRKFVEAEPDYPEAQPAIGLIAELYLVERRAQEWLAEYLHNKYGADPPPISAAERAEYHQHLLRLRQSESKPLVEKLKQYLLTLYPLPESALGKAKRYALEYWVGLTKFLDDPRIPIDNNLVEREMRPVALGRKNYYGSHTKRGTEMAAAFYSLIETAKLSGVEPSYYLATAARRAIENPGAATLPQDLRQN